MSCCCSSSTGWTSLCSCSDVVFSTVEVPRFSSPAESWDCWALGRDSAENCGGSAVFVPGGDADNMVTWMLTCPLLCMTAACDGPDSTVLGRGC